MSFVTTWMQLAYGLAARLLIDLVSLLMSPYLAMQYEAKQSPPLSEIKTVFVTGASSGIGRYIAVRHSNEDTNVVIIGRNQQRLDQTVRLCKMKNAKSVTVRVMDTTDKEGMQALIDEVDEQTPIDIVYVNAGIGMKTVSDPHYFVAAEEFVSINLQGSLNTILPCVSRFRERKRGHIAIVGSMTSFFPLVRGNLYSATKSALYHIFEDMRPQLKYYGVGMSFSAPGYTDTRLFPKTQAPKDFAEPIRKAEVVASEIVESTMNGRNFIAEPNGLFTKAWLAGSLHPYVWQLFADSGIAFRPPTRSEANESFSKRDYFTPKEGDDGAWH